MQVRLYDVRCSTELTFRGGTCKHFGSGPGCCKSGLCVFDPHRFGLFPAFPKQWFTYSLFTDLERLIDHGTNTLRGFEAMQRSRYDEIIDGTPWDVSWPNLRAAIWKWFEMDGSASNADFDCPICSAEEESIWICDGTLRVKIKQHRMPDLPDQHGPPPPSTPEEAAAAQQRAEQSRQAPVLYVSFYACLICMLFLLFASSAVFIVLSF